LETLVKFGICPTVLTVRKTKTPARWRAHPGQMSKQISFKNENTPQRPPLQGVSIRTATGTVPGGDGLRRYLVTATCRPWRGFWRLS